MSHWPTRRWIPSAKKILGCVRSWHVRCTHTSMTKITTPSENRSTWHTLSPIYILHSTVNVGSTNTFYRQKLDYCALSLFGGIHGTIVNCYLASASVNNTLPLSSVYQISPDIRCHLPGKSQSSAAGNNGAPTSVPLSLGHALYKRAIEQYDIQSRYGLCRIREVGQCRPEPLRNIYERRFLLKNSWLIVAIQ